VELEQRVKTLEYELKILKNEIQRTLLDIQEQVLIHYYPALRSDDSAPPDGTLQAIEAIRSKQVTAAPPVAQMSAAQPASVSQVAVAPAPAGVPKAKAVTLDEIRAVQGGAAAPQAANVPAAPAGGDQAVMVRLSGWVNESTIRIGGERITKLIQACVARGVVPADSKDVLLRFASLNKDAAPEKVAANDILAVILKLDELMGRPADIEEALVIIEEANLG